MQSIEIALQTLGQVHPHPHPHPQTVWNNFVACLQSALAELCEAWQDKAVAKPVQSTYRLSDLSPKISQ